jgi:integrase
MGRTPTKNLNLPSGMRARHRPSGTYYYVEVVESGKRREKPVGKDYTEAVRQWAELNSNPCAGKTITFRRAAERYIKDVLPSKALRTQEDNLDELEVLYKFFDDPPTALDDIEPIHIRQFLDWRVRWTVERKKAENVKRVADGKEPLPVRPNAGHVRANREKALFSHIWNHAREKGLTKLPNPCAGVKGHREVGRDVYVEDIVYNAVRSSAVDWLQDLLDLAYLVGQRPADSLKVSRTDVKEGAVWVQQNKTGAKLRVAIEGQLRTVINRIMARNAAEKVTSLRLIPKSYNQFRGAFDKARKLAAEHHPSLAAAVHEFQFRDLRAKAGTDKEEQQGLEAAQSQLGHASASMTRHYVRHRKGKLVTPTK